LDAFKAGFISYDDQIAFSELDALGTKKATLTFWEHVHLAFNNRKFATATEVLNADWGGRYFLEAHCLDWSEFDKLGVDPLFDAKTTKTHFMQLRNKMIHVYNNWGLSGNGDGMLIEKTIETTKSRAPVSTEMLSTKGGDCMEFFGQNMSPSFMYLWFQLLTNGLWNYGKSQLPPSIWADGSMVPNVLQHDTSNMGMCK